MMRFSSKLLISPPSLTASLLMLALLATNGLAVAAPIQDKASASPQSGVSKAEPTRVYDRAINFRKEDTRLQKHVSVDKPFVYLGELLEMLAQQSDVSVSATDADGAAGEELTAVLADMPLSDAMESLVSLLSRDGVRWRWRREGDGSRARPYEYRLLRPADRVPVYAEQVKKRIQAEYEKQAEIMIAGLDMSPEELRRKAREYPCLDYLINGTTTSYGVKAFRDSLTPEQRKQVLRNWGEGIKIPLSELHSSGKQAEANMHNDAQELNPGTVFKVDSAHFWTSDDDGIPDMVIGFGELGGWGYIGNKPVKATELKQSEKEWLRADEEKKHNAAKETGTLPVPKDRKRTPQQPDIGAMPERFQYIANQGGFSLLARLQRDGNSAYNLEPWSKPIAEYLAEMESDRNLMQKWRTTADGKPVLLLDYMAWYKQDMDPKYLRTPWDIVKQLRAEQARNTNASAMMAMLLAGANLNEAQLLRLVEREFPALSPIREVNYFYAPFFAWVQANPKQYEALVTPRGTSLSDLPPVLQNLLPGIVQNRVAGTAAAVAAARDTQRFRFVIAEEVDRTTSWRIETLGGDGTVIGIKAFPTWQAK